MRSFCSSVFGEPFSFFDVIYGVCVYTDEELRISKFLKSQNAIENHTLTLNSSHTILHQASQEEKTGISFVLPASDTLVLNLNVPLTLKKKAKDVIPSMLDVQLPFPLEDCIYKVISAKKLKDGTYNFTTIVVRRNVLEKHIAFFKDRGIELDFIDSEALILFNIGSSIFPQNQKFAVINAEKKSLSFIISEEHTLKSVYTLKLNQKIENTEIERWLKRIIKIENFDTQSFKIILTGREASSTHFTELLSKVMPLQPQQLINVSNPDFAVSEEAAKRIYLKQGNALNFLENEYNSNKIRRMYASFARRRAITLIVASTVLLIVNLLHFLLWQIKKIHLEEKIAAITQMVIPETRLPKGMETFEINRRIQQNLEEFAPLLELIENKVISTFSDITSLIIKKNILLSNISLRQNQILLSGNVANWQDCEELVDLLKEKGFIVTVEKKTSSGLNSLSFLIKAEKQKKINF